MAHSSGGRLAGRPVGGWTSHRKNAPSLYFHTTRDTTAREASTAVEQTARALFIQTVARFDERDAVYGLVHLISPGSNPPHSACETLPQILSAAIRTSALGVVGT